MVARVAASVAAEARNGYRPGREVVLTKASRLTPEPIAWAWRERLPLGALTTFAGQQGLGKTLVAMKVVADATRGGLDGDLDGQPATCLVATAEDALESVLLPRLIAADADRQRVHFVTAREGGVEQPLTLPDDAAALAKKAEAVEARLVVIDPLGAFLPGHTDSHKDADVRRALAPVATLAADRRLAVLAVAHLNKGTASDALIRISGSGAFTAAPRSVLILGADPDDADAERGGRRILAHAKSNLGPLAPSLACRIEGREVEASDGNSISTALIAFEGESGHSARDVLLIPSEEERGARCEAVEFLVARLANGPIRSKELFSAGRDAGISESTLRRAKKDHGVVAEQKADGWYWSLPDEEPS